MGFFGKAFKSLAPIAATIGGNMIAPGLGSAAGALVGGAITGKNTKKNAQQVFQDVQAAGHANQSNAQGDSSNWTFDPATKQWSQAQKYSPERQAQFDAFNKMATNRMNIAAGLDPTGASYQADYEKMGLGALLGGDKGTTGKRPWADDKYSSLGGDALKYLQYAGPGPDVPLTQTWGASPMPTQGQPPPPPPGGPAAGGGLIGGTMPNRTPPPYLGN
jgi:hypothetical protein